MSHTSDLAWRPARTPSVPKYTSSTSEGNPTIEKTRSLRWATTFAVGHHVAPAASSSDAFSRVLVVSDTGYPAFNRWPHIDLPMTPMPTQPTRDSVMLPFTRFLRFDRVPLTQPRFFLLQCDGWDVHEIPIAGNHLHCRGHRAQHPPRGSVGQVGRPGRSLDG